MAIDTVPTVVAARSGDPRARNDLIAAHLPLVYDVVGRALGPDADVDDVVQETLLRAVRELSSLRRPESFRSWIMAIAVRQVATQRSRRRVARERAGGLDDAQQVADRRDLEEETLLRLQVADQRTELVEAARWLDQDSRTLLALWVREASGDLTRTDVAQACGLSRSHVRVRIQRLRDALDRARGLVAALAADPRCPGLDRTLYGWDGQRSSVWRKRIERHVRDCVRCTGCATDRAPVERLVARVPVLAVPPALWAWLHAGGLLPGGVGAGAAATSGAAHLAGSGGPVALATKTGAGILAHPVAASLTGVALVGAATLTAAFWPEMREPEPESAVVTTSPSASPVPTRSAAPETVEPEIAAPWTAPSPEPTPADDAVAESEQAPPESDGRTAQEPEPAGTVPLGAVSLELASRPGWYLAASGSAVAFAEVRPDAVASELGPVSLVAVAGLANAECVTFQTDDGSYLRHNGLQVEEGAVDGSELFRDDATFCPEPGPLEGSTVLRSTNYPAIVLAARDDGVYLETPDGSDEFAARSSFLVREALDGRAEDDIGSPETP